jgi:hypothetical protein
MRKTLRTASGPTRTRFRGIIMTMLLMALTVLIVRDILVKWWGSPPPAPDVTRRLR